MQSFVHASSSAHPSAVGGGVEEGPDFIDPGKSNIQDGATSGAFTDTNAGLVVDETRERQLLVVFYL